MASRNEAAPLLISHQGSEHPNPDPSTSLTKHQRARTQTRTALDSKAAHYSIVLLVVCDLVIIFAEFLLQLFQCEHECRRGDGGRGGGGTIDGDSGAARAQTALGIVSLVFSCVFMVELLVSVWAFGREFFHSAFRTFDGLVIVVGFVIDVGLKGVLEEVGSVIIVLRLWRVFKVIGELSAQAAEQVGDLNEAIARLKGENAELKRTVDGLKERRVGGISS